RSEDGITWNSIALVEDADEDLRDAKLSVMPDGRFLLNGAGMRANEQIRYHSMIWTSADQGKTWSEGKQIGDPGFWLWRIQWHNGIAYTMGYATDRDREKRSLRFYRSENGTDYETWIEAVNVQKGVGEDRILFLKDETALCLLRCETGTKNGKLGRSTPPYKEWEWTETSHRIGGPNMIELPDGRLLGAVRLYTPKQRASLVWIDPETATLTECLELPSGGDTSYAGMVLRDDVLWISYYSSHEEKTAIYLARIRCK
ncbi:MAG: exo-alpha-sialidase, partial [Planctomycetaceae bacterium]|nr:exo-alpha-sialidase [Planctomycetaceae bacterium]